MRSTVVFVVLVLASSIGRPRVASAQRTEDLARARTADQQGVKAYAEGRYADAIRYFEESYRLGGPPFELSNVAKCYTKLEQPAPAAEALERYLAIPTLPNNDRQEATQQLEALRRRPSTLTVASSPNGASVLLDGKPVDGAKGTPTSFAVPPGAHTITLTAPGLEPHTQPIEARYGRAIVLDVSMEKERSAPPPADRSPEAARLRRVAVRAHFGVMLPRYGAVGGAPHATVALNGTYHFVDVRATSLAGGLMFTVTGDSWANATGAPTSLQPCGTLRNPNSATALSAFAMGSAGWDVFSRARLHALAGVGVAAYSADDLGGDVFVPRCSPSPSVRPAMILGAQLDYAITPLVRLSALPLLLQIQPSFEGVRFSTSGTWLRGTIAIGAGVDL